MLLAAHHLCRAVPRHRRVRGRPRSRHAAAALAAARLAIRPQPSALLTAHALLEQVALGRREFIRLCGRRTSAGAEVSLARCLPAAAAASSPAQRMLQSTAAPIGQYTPGKVCMHVSASAHPTPSGAAAGGQRPGLPQARWPPGLPHQHLQALVNWFSRRHVRPMHHFRWVSVRCHEPAPFPTLAALLLERLRHYRAGS